MGLVSMSWLCAMGSHVECTHERYDKCECPCHRPVGPDDDERTASWKTAVQQARDGAVDDQIVDTLTAAARILAAAHERVIIGPIEEAFWAFHAVNPHVYRRLVTLARDLKARGRRKIGIGMLFEVLRWEHLMETSDPDGFKLNNNYRALYARLIMHREPDLDGIFELRRLHGATEPFGQHTVPPDGHVPPGGSA